MTTSQTESNISTDNMQPPRAVFIGCGPRAGGTLQQFLDAGGQVVAICDPSQKPLDRFDTPDNTPRFYELAPMLDSVDADMAFIASPNFVHAEQFIACAEAGLHTWIEKPIALTLDDANAMRDAANKAGIKVAIPFGANEKPDQRDVIDAFRRDEFGPFVQMSMTRLCGAGLHIDGGSHYAIEQPEVSGGWIAHHLCHMIDFAMQLGGPVDRVYCQTETTFSDPKPHQEETIACTLHFQNGGTANLCDMQSKHQMAHTSIVGQRGTWVMRQEKTHIRQNTDDTLYAIDRTFKDSHELTQWNPEKYREYVAAQPTYVKQFINASLRGGPWHTTIDRGIDVMRVYLAAQESARTGQAVSICA